MKNSKKLIGLTVALLSVAGLAACGGAKNDGGSSKPASGSSKCSHKWVVDEAASVAATCTTEGKKVQKCSVCGEVKETKQSKTSHKYEEVAGGVAATCTEAGSRVKKCSVCGDTKTEEVEALGHDFVDDADQSAAKQATCTEAGERIQHCSRCNEENKEEVRALGHEYGETTWTKAATCTEAGVGSHECSRCKNVEAVTEDALGHDIQLIGDDTEPEAGKAKVRVYTCARECGTTYFGFKASEPSEASKEHLVIGEDGGAKFWGRPIGNAMELNESGDASGADAEKIYDPTVSGDYFEYVFDLTAAQLATMGEQQHLYCEASAANYLSGKDFWAADPSGAEWTPGYYIEGEHAGEAIADYRYILYVDDKPQEFDATMLAPVTGSATNQPKKEYVMPYTFKLHEGTNKIRLVMAGGYKSTFYNFTFRPAEKAADPEPGEDPEPVAHEHKWVAGEKVGAYTLETCDCGLKAYNFNVGDATGWNQPTTKMNGKTSPNNRSTWANPGIPEGKYEFQINAKMTSAGHASRYFYNQWETDTASSPDKETEDPFRYFLSVNGGDKVYNPRVDKNWGELGLDANNFKYAVMNVEEDVGAITSLELNHGNIGYSLIISNVRLVCLKEVPHEHTWAEPEEMEMEGCSKGVVEVCACGKCRMTINAKDTTEGALKSDKLQKGTSGNYDGTNGVTYKFAVAGAGKAQLLAKVWVDNAGNWTEANGYSYATGKVNGSTVKVLDNGATNTTLKVNGADVAMPTTTYYEMGIRGTTAADAGIADFGMIDVVEGINSFALAATNSYGLCYGEFYVIL